MQFCNKFMHNFVKTFINLYFAYTVLTLSRVNVRLSYRFGGLSNCHPCLCKNLYVNKRKRRLTTDFTPKPILIHLITDLILTRVGTKYS